MVAFEENAIALTREQRNMFALQSPRAGDAWFERGFYPAGEVEFVLKGKYVAVKLKEGEYRFWNLKEYAQYYCYKSNPQATWCDVRLSPIGHEPLEIEWYVYFFFNRWRQKWRERKRYWGKKPHTFTVGGWTLKLERKAR